MFKNKNKMKKEIKEDLKKVEEEKTGKIQHMKTKIMKQNTNQKPDPTKLP